MQFKETHGYSSSIIVGATLASDWRW